MELISVVIPVYKVERYLKKCVDSVLSQTYTDLEVILVDDGSPDLCGVICDEYKKADSRVVVIHKENGGLSDARNAAIDIFNGDFITFIDSDDWVDPNYIESLYCALKKHDANFSICGFKYITEEGKVLNSFSEDKSIQLLENKNALISLMKSKEINTSAWGKLYKRELFVNRRYPTGKLFEDIPVTYDIVISGVKVACIATPAYNYLYRESAISKMSFNLRRLDSVKFIEEAMGKVVEKYPELSHLVPLCLFRVNFQLLMTYDNSTQYRRQRKQTLANLKRHRLHVLFSKESSRSLKIQALFCFLPGSLISKAYIIISAKRRQLK